MNKFNWFLPLTLVAGMALTAQAPASERHLSLGDAAPELKVKWLKGAPVVTFDPAKMYILEFWATWCGPCRAAMPHLSNLARKHQGRIEVIGVNIFESGYRDKPYEDFLPKVKKFVEEMGDGMAYKVAMDSNDLFMTNHWMKAASQSGIPASFLVKGGKVIWIGHPGDLDEVIGQVEQGTYDLAARAKAFDENARKERALAPAQKQLVDLFEKVTSAIAVRNYAKALELIDAASPTLPPEFKASLDYQRLRVLVRKDLGRFFTLAGAMHAQDPKTGLTSADVIMKLKDESIAEGLCLFAIAQYQEALDKKLYPQVPDAYLHNWISICYNRCGRFGEAAGAQEKAVALAKEALASGKHGGITKGLLEDYEKALAEYRQKSAKVQ